MNISFEDEDWGNEEEEEDDEEDLGFEDDF
jgi:hypothetical protein